MTGTTPELMEELLQAIEQRDAGDPDAPAWEACRRIDRLEAELTSRLNAGEAAAVAAVDSTRALRLEEALAGVA